MLKVFRYRAVKEILDAGKSVAGFVLEPGVRQLFHSSFQGVNFQLNAGT